MEKEDEANTPAANDGWRNSFAPNDGYQHFDEVEKQISNIERRRSSARRQSSLVTEQEFKNQAYGMLRTQKNPKPNFTDRALHKIYKTAKLYIPMSTILAVLDYVLDWRNSVQLINSSHCSDRAFGAMMLSTVLVIPMVFAIINPSLEEYDMWDTIFRKVFKAQEKDPYGDVEEEKAPIHVRAVATVFYVLFSPFTHLVTQICLHTGSADNVEYYLEFAQRKNKVMKQFHLGAFTSYDENELDTLKELQWRASSYVQYYIKYAKDRLRYCLIEDSLQFNIQFAMFLFNMYTAPTAHPSSFQYLQDSTIMWAKVYPETYMVWDAFVLVCGLITSIFMLWQGFFLIERYQEQLNSRENIGLIRMLALSFKAMIELMTPSFGLIVLMIKYPVVDNQGHEETDLYTCESSYWFGNMIKFYIAFVCVYSLGINLVWSFLLNLSNKGADGVLPILKESFRMSIYTSSLSVKYNRIADYNETVIENENFIGLKQVAVLAGANFVRFLPLLITVAAFEPTNYKSIKVRAYAVTNDINYLSYMNQGVRLEGGLSDLKTEQVYPHMIRYDQDAIENFDFNVTNDATSKYVCSTAAKTCITRFHTKHQIPSRSKDETERVVGLRILCSHDYKFTTIDGVEINKCDADTYKGLIDGDAGSKMEDVKKMFGELGVSKTTTFPEAKSLNFYESIIDTTIFDNDGQEVPDEPTDSMKEFRRYMVKDMPDGIRTSPAAMRGKLIMYTMLLWIAYTALYYMSEPTVITSKYIRTNLEWVKMLYPLLMPFTIIYLSYQFQFSAIENQIPSFCRMFPERKNTGSLMSLLPQDSEFNCIDGMYFRSISRCSLGTTCFYTDKSAESTHLMADGKGPQDLFTNQDPSTENDNTITRLKVFNSPSEIFDQNKNSKLEDISRYIKREIQKKLTSEPKLTNAVCLTWRGIENSQLGDVLYPSRDKKHENDIVRETEKCQRVLTQLALENSAMENFYTATYKAEDSEIKEAKEKINAKKTSFYEKIESANVIDFEYTYQEDSKYEITANGTDAIDKFFGHISSHLDKNLECYTLEANTHKACLNYQGPNDKGGVGEECGHSSEDLSATNMEMWMAGENELLDATYDFFQNTFDKGCSTNFKSCQTDFCPAPRLYSGKASKLLIDGLVEDVDRSFIVYPKDAAEQPIFVNWPELIASREAEETIIINPLYGKINGRNTSQTSFVVTEKTAQFDADTDPDSNINSPLFNPFYHYAFDVYGSNTVRDLQGIPFEKMGEALDEIHNNIGPWMIPYEPPNVGPAKTNALPKFRVRATDSAKYVPDLKNLLGSPMEVDIINMPQDLRLDTGDSLWHYYIHAILFPFSAPLPWWTSTEDPNLKTIQAHTFTANDRLIGANGSPYTGTLFRQISPILSFLYDNVDSSGNTIRQNSYFSVPIWAEEEDYKDLTSASFIQWKKDQPEYVNVQSSSTPWVDGAEVPADMENSCVVTNGNRTKVFGIGAGSGSNADTFAWHNYGFGNHKRFRVDEDYLIFGPGGEGLKRTPFNPLIYQYEFDDKLRKAIRDLTYKGNPAVKNWDDGMGWAIDDALDTDGMDKDNFNIKMSLYLFTNLMTHLWPKDYDYRYVLPYTYDFDSGKDSTQPGTDVPFTSKCQNGEYTILEGPQGGSGKKMWCIGGPIAFNPNHSPEDWDNNHSAGDPMDLRDVTLGRVYKPQADFIRNYTDFFPFMDLGDPFNNQAFAAKHKFGILHKFWDTPSRLKIYSTTKPFAHYKPRFEQSKVQTNAKWYKPYYNVQHHSNENLKYVNTWAADIESDKFTISDFWPKYEATNYHQKIKDFNTSATTQYDGYQVLHRPMEEEGDMVPLLNDRATYGMESWQRVYTRKNKKSLSPGWHFFGREWDFTETSLRQDAYKTDDDINNNFFAEVFEADYSLYNALPDSPIFVRTDNRLTEREAECIMSQPEMDTANYRRPLADSPGVAISYCQPNVHFMLNNTNWLKDTLAEPLEKLQLFNPAQSNYDDEKSYTHHNYGDLHITPPCVTHGDSAYVFGQVRRLKPFYYYYCDKWVNSMGQHKVNLATDGGKLSTRPCSKKVLDPLNRFQPWDNYPQTAFADRTVSDDPAENAVLTRPFILSDPEIVAPYSLVFKYNFENDTFDNVEVLPNGMSPQRGACVSSKAHPDKGSDKASGGALLCFGGLIKGRATNMAIALIDNKWYNSNINPNDDKAGFLAEMNLPLPLIDHSVIEVGKDELYIFGGRSLLFNPVFKRGTKNEIIERGKKFMQYGYRRDIPTLAVNDEDFINDNNPIKQLGKVSGEQMYPPLFGDPEEYGYAAKDQTTAKRPGDAFADYKANEFVYVYTGLAVNGGSGWQKLRSWRHRGSPVSEVIFRRQYAYMFTNEDLRRHRGRRKDLIYERENEEHREDESGNSRRRRSLEYLKMMQSGKHAANVGPFLSGSQARMIYESSTTGNPAVLPNDWSTVMGEFFADDYHSGQNCKICDATGSTISFLKFARDPNSVFSMKAEDTLSYFADGKKLHQAPFVLEINNEEFFGDHLA